MNHDARRSFLIWLFAVTAGACGGDRNGAENNGTIVGDASDRDGDGLPNEDEELLGTDPDNPDTDGDGILDGAEKALGTRPALADTICTEDRYSADFRYKPVDVLFVIDNSGSMREEVESIEANINVNFVAIMDEAGLDYRVILITRHGEGGVFDSDICISNPLSSTTCVPVPERPGNTDRFFHYDVEVSSDDAMERFFATFDRPDPHGMAPGGWSDWLRPNAFKPIVIITDDESSAPIGSRSSDATGFEETILSLPNGPFGKPGSRNYEVHSIIGVGAKANPQEAYLPSEPMVMTQCATAESRGDAYQRLSIVTGGVRYPVCEHDSYDAVFREVADAIVEDAQINCSMRLPPVVQDEIIDPNRLVLQYTDSAGAATEVVTRVESEAACGERNFYLLGATIELCPALCARATASSSGELVVLAQCDVRACDNPTTEVCDDGVDNDCDGFTDRADVQCIL